MEYFYDDPADDTDDADVPKVGYARQFKGEFDTGDRVITFDFIVGSGFYGSAPDVVATGPRTVVGATVLGDAVAGLDVEFSRAIAGPPVQLRMERRHQCQWRIYPDHLQPGRGERLLPCPRP